jgi:hypothetical protein
MSFPWLHPVIPASYSAAAPGKALAMYRDEIRQRAALLRRLGYPEQQAAARCRQNLAWDFELHGRCPVADEVDALVQAVYRRGPDSVVAVPPL